MAIPSTFSDLPLGIIRSSFGGRLVWLIDTELPFAQNTPVMTLADTMTASDKAKRYWVFSSVKSAHDKTNGDYTISLPNPHAVKSAGFDTYDEAEEQYETWAKSDAGKPSAKRGLAGLQNIGKEG